MTFRNKATALVIMTALAGISAPAFAQWANAPPSYYEAGPWKVRDVSKRFCMLEHSGDENGRLLLTKSSTEAAYFTFSVSIPRPYPSSSVGIEWLFDDTTVSGHLLSGRHYQIPEGTADIEAMFRKSDTLTITDNDETIATIDLTGSAAAFRKAKDCADQYPNSTVPMIPPPAPPAILPANRPLTPIRQQQWIVDTDRTGANYHLLRVDRVVGYRLEVSPRGTVQRCMITRSSGSSQIDANTCKLLTRRARFLAQTNESGKAVRGAFSGTVRWTENEPLKDAQND